MKKTTTKQLKLLAETVRQLTATELDSVVGGAKYTSACANQSGTCPSLRTTTK